MCYEDQIDFRPETDTPRNDRPNGRCKEGISVLGMITLSDMNKLRDEGLGIRGWIACKSQFYQVASGEC